ncbi:hypothetical protein BDA96_02G430600 [Sorghum bicolor]|uniref:Uncharacterized protein n=2 Tax=Sorghum bicolor TaxID=4558 RepID=A0A921RV26_SORBI|nr:hypothetical protein BDA96_10G145400 [Sorghum bicolor]KAG0546244.1 hypothetical protein BDA96_02G430600 [Sorghum bicolor]OQU76244.1 hypothetical protein SORBI_3010G118550 [Sorghum bicolor]
MQGLLSLLPVYFSTHVHGFQPIYTCILDRIHKTAHSCTIKWLYGVCNVFHSGIRCLFSVKFLIMRFSEL